MWFVFCAVVVLTGLVKCGCVCMCGFCKVWVCVCVDFVMCGCFGNMCTVFTVFCIVCTVFWYCFVYVYYLFCLY